VETEDLDRQTEQTMFQVRQLQEQAKDLPEQIRALERIQRQIPAAVDVPALLRDIQRTARANDVSVETLTPGQITVFTTEQPTSDPQPTTGTDGATGTEGSSPDGAEGTTGEGTAPVPTPTPSNLGQGRLPEGVGLSYVPITVTAIGEFGNLKDFTTDVENLQRAYLITGMQLARTDATDVQAKNPLTMSLDSRVFVASDRLRNLPSEALEQMEGQ
jgi:Tfp pilus assembly protein PilO